MEQDNLDKLNQTADEALQNNPLIAQLAKTPAGQKMILNKAIKMLKHQRPDLTEDQLNEIREAAAFGGLEGLEEKLAEYDIIK